MGAARGLLGGGGGGVSKLLPTLEDCVRERDYAGALAILDFERKTAHGPRSVVGEEELERRLWVGYCAFHAGEYEQAQAVYQGLIDELEQSHDSSPSTKIPPEVHLYLACCLYYLQEYEQAERTAQRYDPGAGGQEEEAQRLPSSSLQPQRQQEGAGETNGGDGGAGESGTPPLPAPGEMLRNRLLFHIAHKLGNESKLLLYHQRLTDTMEDQLSLAAIHFLRSHFQEVGGCLCCYLLCFALLWWMHITLLCPCCSQMHPHIYTRHTCVQATEIYKRLLLENRGELALNVYVAMCYYKMDYYDVALEILAVYLQVRGWVGDCLLTGEQASDEGFGCNAPTAIPIHTQTHTPPGVPRLLRGGEPQGLQPLPPLQRQGGRGGAQGPRRPGPLSA